MPEVTASSTEDVRLGTQMVSALMVGNREIFVRFAKITYSNPGNFSYTLPDWVTGYGVIMSGGGGGGQAGDSALGNRRYGGQGGSIHGVWGWLSTTNKRVLSGVIGAGGTGGSSPDSYGQSGGTTTITTHNSNVYSAKGGAGNPTVSGQDGGVTVVTYLEPFARYVNIVPGTTYSNGPAGSGNGGVGQRGGGGAGGNGGIFGNYTKGGRGGHGFVEIYAWGFPRDQGGVERITLGSDLEARDQFRTALSDRGLNYQTVEYLPFDIDLIGAGSARELFRGCASLKSVPNMDTTGVTNMRSMFYDCQSLTSVPEMDTSSVMNMQSMFEGCSALTSVPDMDTSGVVITAFMFYGCSSLTDGNVRLIGRASPIDYRDMIDNSGLTRLPFYDTDGNPI